jgi:hypothetical protein
VKQNVELERSSQTVERILAGCQRIQKDDPSDGALRERIVQLQQAPGLTEKSD